MSLSLQVTQNSVPQSVNVNGSNPSLSSLSQSVSQPRASASSRARSQRHGSNPNQSAAVSTSTSTPNQPTLAPSEFKLSPSPSSAHDTVDSYTAPSRRSSNSRRHTATISHESQSHLQSTSAAAAIAAAASSSTPVAVSKPTAHGASPTARNLGSSAPQASSTSSSSSKSLGTDDDSISYLSKFTFPPVEGEPGGTFQTWIHYTPIDDMLQCTLMQQSGPYRIYTFHGKLTQLRPMGLYMAGMKDGDYRNYVLNGLCEQDTKENYEYEFTTTDDIDDMEGLVTASDSDSELRAHLRLYKQMGDSTRVPVCIAHLKFETLQLGPTTSSTGRRQETMQYQTNFSQLLTHLSKYVHLLKIRRNVREQEIEKLQAESKISEELERLPTVVSLVDSGHELIDRIATVLNHRKQRIREMRTVNEELRAQCEALKPKRRIVKKQEESSSSSSEEEEEEEKNQGEEYQEDIGDNGDNLPSNDPSVNALAARSKQLTSHRSRRPLPSSSSLLSSSPSIPLNVSPHAPVPMEIDGESQQPATDLNLAPPQADRRTSQRSSNHTVTTVSLAPTMAGALTPSASARSLDRSLSFGFDSIEPAYGLNSIPSPSIGSPPGSGSGRATPGAGGSGGGSGSGSRFSRARLNPQHQPPLLNDLPPTHQSSSSLLELSPPRAKTMVRKRARPLPAAATVAPSPSILSSSFGDSPGTRGATIVASSTVALPPVPPAAAVGDGVGRVSSARSSRSRDASQVIRELASVNANGNTNSTTARRNPALPPAGPAAVASNEHQPSGPPSSTSNGTNPNKKQRTQGSMSEQRGEEREQW